MQKRLLLLSGIFSILVLSIGCSKDDDDPPPQQTTKTELLVKATWKLEKAEAAGFGDVTNQLEDCMKDDQITFTSTANRKGTGVADEGAVKCGAAQQTTFNWTLNDTETTLTSDKPLFSGGSGDFTIVSLNETNLVVKQQMTFPGAPGPITVTLTLKH